MKKAGKEKGEDSDVQKYIVSYTISVISKLHAVHILLVPISSASTKLLYNV